MKRIFLGKVEDNQVAVILKNWIETAPADSNGRFPTIGDIRERLKIVEKLEEAGEAKFVDFEDSDCAALLRIIGNMRFPVANKAVVEIADRIADAKAPPKVELKEVK